MNKLLTATLAGSILTVALSAVALAQTPPAAPTPMPIPTPAPMATPVSVPSSLPPTGPLGVPSP